MAKRSEHEQQELLRQILHGNSVTRPGAARRPGAKPRARQQDLFGGQGGLLQEDAAEQAVPGEREVRQAVPARQQPSVFDDLEEAAPARVASSARRVDYTPNYGDEPDEYDDDYDDEDDLDSYLPQEDDYDQPGRKRRGGAAVKTRRRGSAVGWILAALIVLLIGAAAFLGYLLLTDKLELPFGNKSPDFAGGNPALLETSDAGDRYVDSTIFVGDSNLLRLSTFQITNVGQVAAQEGIGIQAVTNLPFLMLRDRTDPATVVEAIQELQPPRVLIMLGTNDIGNLSVEDFTLAYGQVLDALKGASPQTEFIVAGIPPVAAGQTSYPNLTLEAIRAYNSALRKMCAEKEIPYLDTHEALAGEDGYCKAEYVDPDGMHLNQKALGVLLDYYRTHAWKP